MGKCKNEQCIVLVQNWHVIVTQKMKIFMVESLLSERWWIYMDVQYKKVPQHKTFFFFLYKRKKMLNVLFISSLFSTRDNLGNLFKFSQPYFSSRTAARSFFFVWFPRKVQTMHYKKPLEKFIDTMDTSAHRSSSSTPKTHNLLRTGLHSLGWLTKRPGWP